MKVVSLLSGGIDSCTTASKLAIDGFDVFPLFVDYGQRAVQREINAAEGYVSEVRARIEKMHALSTANVSMPFLRSSLVGTADVEKNTGENFGTMESKKVDWVPARNIILITLAASYCETVGARKISIGAYREDEMPPYPDSSRDFFDVMQQALTSGMYGDAFEIVTPFIDSFKWDLLTYSRDKNLPTHLTWSCYENLQSHCGYCRNCVDRKKAFDKAGIKDPTIYCG